MLQKVEPVLGFLVAASIHRFWQETGVQMSNVKLPG